MRARLPNLRLLVGGTVIAFSLYLNEHLFRARCTRA
jgi:hypothetical protein